MYFLWLLGWVLLALGVLSVTALFAPPEDRRAGASAHRVLLLSAGLLVTAAALLTLTWTE